MEKKKNRLFFLFFILIYFSCNNSTNKPTTSEHNPHVRGEIIRIELGNYKPFYHGHPPGLSTTLVLTNNSDGAYLMCGLEGNVILKNKDFADTFLFIEPILIEPYSVDTIHNTFFISKDREKIIPSNYTGGDLIYEATSECKLDSSLNRFNPVYFKEISLNSIKPIKHLVFINTVKK